MRNLIESIAVGCARVLMNAAYCICNLLPRRDEAIFVSRQTNHPSYDFRALGQAFETQGYQVVYLTQKFSKKTVIRYLVHALREIYHLARCRICFVDRYDPLICLVRFKSERVVLSEVDEMRGAYDSFPVEPVIVQIWHAFGAFKRFGFQSQDTPEGHPKSKMKRYRIHRNYSWILCSGEGSRLAFSQAFNCPLERVVPLMRPEYDELKRLRKAQKSLTDLDEEKSKAKSVLFAPTLRKSDDSKHPFRDLYDSKEWKSIEGEASVVWAFHPLDQGAAVAGKVSEVLLSASLVITDYSSIAYEAYLLGKPVVFFVEGIEEYRISPGLNVDPLIECGMITFTEEKEMLSFVRSLLRNESVYPWEELKRFANIMIDETDDCAVDALLERSLSWIRREG